MEDLPLVVSLKILTPVDIPTRQLAKVTQVFVYQLITHIELGYQVQRSFM